jgi:hypothetical protein
MLHISITCGTVFAHRRFRYRAGALHSANDEPAAVFAPNSRAYMKGVYLAKVYGNDTYGNDTSFGAAIYRTRRSLKHGQTRWYCDGELHRDYGPAVVGAVGKTLRS